MTATAASAAPLAGAPVASPSPEPVTHPAHAELPEERQARDRRAPPGERAAALRRLAAAQPAAALHVARDALREPAVEGLSGPYAAQALRTLAALAKNDARAQARELGEYGLAVLARTSDPEVALACGFLLDAAAASGLEPATLRAALPTTPLPEARLVLLRALALCAAPVEREAAAEQLLRDPSDLVRTEALAALAPRQLAALALAIAADPALRRAAPRALRRRRGPEAEYVLQVCAGPRPSPAPRRPDPR